MVAILDPYGRPILAERPRVVSPPIRARYDVAQTTDDNRRHWAAADALSADAANSPGVRRKIRNRARYEVANNSYARGITRTLANDVIGTGPRLRLRTGSRIVDQLVTRNWSNWALEIRLAEKLRTMRLAQCQDGEGFAHYRTNQRLRHAVKLDLRLFEAELCTTPGMRPVQPDAVDGIRFDPNGNPLEYHVLRRHPGDLYGGVPWEYDRLPADQVVHVFRAERPGQHRGVSEILPSLPLFAELRRFTLAVIAAAETAANHAGVMESMMPPGSEPAPNEDGPFSMIELERRMLMALPEGWKLSQLKAEQPTTTYPQFKREILAEIARCLNMPLNVALGDSSGYNYSSGRLDHQVYFKQVSLDRFYYEVQVLARLFAAWCVEAQLVGILPQGLLQLDQWQIGWDWDPNEDIDPQKTAAAQRDQLTYGLTTLPLIYAENGLDFEAEMIRQAELLGVSREELLRALFQRLYGVPGLTPPPSPIIPDQGAPHALVPVAV